MGEDDPSKEYSRRTVLAALAAGGATVGAAGNVVAAPLQQHSAVADYGALEVSMQGMAYSGGVARGVNTNRDRTTDVAVTRADDPAGTGRGDVVRITSDGVETPDYGFSVANVRSPQLTLRDLAASETTYDYLGGTPNTSVVPDEVWVVLKPRREKRRYLLRTERDDSLNGWETRDVAAEIGGDINGAISGGGSNQEWKEFLPASRTLTRVGTDLVGQYGADASVFGVGVGRGTPTTSPSQIDTYFDNLVVAGQPTKLPD